ncbi:hypothetical protein KP509_36G042000 [Ceratopteris richardii]|uniref:Uncharacterized protein n=1 Tax=Ceratopteris richardii TaxID=49495 RepID=A0A8T2QCZ5_CERRI|nr:hypothetical protein KP509_36G042000 [Ceratopteris richardii]
MESKDAIKDAQPVDDSLTSRGTVTEISSPSSSSASSVLKRKRRPPQPLLVSEFPVASDRSRVAGRQRHGERQTASPHVFRKILADKSVFKHIVHQLTGSPSLYKHPPSDSSEAPKSLQTLELSCTCRRHGCRIRCRRDALIDGIFRRLSILEAVMTHVLLQGAVPAAQESCVASSLGPNQNRISFKMFLLTHLFQQYLWRNPAHALANPHPQSANIPVANLHAGFSHYSGSPE